MYFKKVQLDNMQLRLNFDTVCFLLLLIMLLTISACGSGGDSGAAPATESSGDESTSPDPDAVGGTVDEWTGTVQLGITTTNLQGIAIDSSDSVYAVGYTNGDLDGQTRTGIIDMYITKYDNLGEKQFTRLLGADWGTTPKTAHAHAVAIDSNDNIYVVGVTTGSFDGNNWLGTISMFLVKFDSDGNKIFSDTFGASATTYPTAISIDASDNIYVTGYESGSFGGSAIGTRDLFLAKFDTEGNMDFVEKLGESGKLVFPQSIATDASGNVYVSGYTTANLNGETLTGTADVFFVKFDASGDVLLTRLSGTPGSILLNAKIAIDSSSNIYITGYTSKSIDDVTPTGLLDTYLMKYDNVGTKVFTKMYGVAGQYVQGMAIKTDSAGNVYITGSTDTALDSNLLAGIYDSFLIKYDSSGVREYAKQLGASGGYASGRAIAIDSGDNIFISGHTDKGLDGNSLNGAQDFFISKYDK